MAERIVSPGVFTRERDLSFLPQGISEIGAAIIGPTKKGPAFVPTLVRSFEDFKKIFGSYDSSYYTPYTVKNYLDSAGTVTIVKVGYLGGYKVAGFNLVVSGSGSTKFVAATFLPSILNSDGAGLIMWLLLRTRQGDNGPNQYGPDPRDDSQEISYSGEVSESTDDSSLDGIKCPACYAENNPQAKFCKKCGGSLENAT